MGAATYFMQKQQPVYGLVIGETGSVSGDLLVWVVLSVA